MKELLLPALLDAKHYIGHRTVLPQACLRWLTMLVGNVVDDGAAVAPRLCHTPRAEVLEVWLRDDRGPGAEAMAGYSRIAFRPLVDASSDADKEAASGVPGASSSSFRFLISIELLPAVRVYLGAPLSEMGLVGASPRLVIMDGQVLPYDALTPRQIGRLDAGYAVLTPELAACLELPGDAARQSTSSSGPYEELRQEIDRLLPLCFSGGGEAEGCPLRLSFRLEEVPARRLFTVDAAHRLLRFGDKGVGESAREGFGCYGACRPAPHRELHFIMLYPRGELDAARRLFNLFSPLCRLVAAMPRGNVDEWVAYDADEHAIDLLTRAFYAHPPTDSAGSRRIYCYITPSGRAVAPLVSGRVSIRLRRLARFFDSLYVGPVPLHAIRPEVFGWHLPTVASRLLVEMGGVPWVPCCFASQASDLVVGFTHSRSGQSEEAFCGGAFYNDPSALCQGSVVAPAERFPFLFSGAFRRAYSCFCSNHNGCPPRRLVVYCHRELPIDPFLDFVNKEVWPYQKALPVVLVQVQRTAGLLPRHYDPQAPGCMPVAGTCLRCADNSYLLFCRHFAPESGRRCFYPSPLEVGLKSLRPDGGLLPLPPAEAADVLVQVCQLVWAHPEGVDGGALPLILSHTDRLVRHHCQEWQVELDDRRAILGGGGNPAI